MRTWWLYDKIRLYLDDVHHRRVGVGPVGARLVEDRDVSGGELPAKMEPGV